MTQRFALEPPGLLPPGAHVTAAPHYPLSLYSAPGPCKFSLDGTVCGCLQGKFDNVDQHVDAAACTICCHPFQSHVSSDSEDDRSPAKRARLDTDASPAPSARTAQPEAFLSKHHLGSDVYKTARNGSSTAIHLPQSNQSWTAFSQCSDILFVDKTKYIELLDEEEHYQYLFLRPRRFGKSTFLNTLCRYYDIAEAATFKDVFGDLYIGKNPTTSRNKHLVLKFDLSTIDVSGHIGIIEKKFSRRINNVLRSFLRKYRNWIEESFNVDDIICEDDAPTSLQQTLVHVKNSGYTLFVAIDEYDAPANNAAFGGSGPATLESRSTKLAAIESFFKGSLFSILKEACGDGYTGCISKYFLTGVLPAFRAGMSPLAATTMISGDPEFHGICGLTSAQAKTVTEAYLGPSTDRPLDDVCWALQKYYNGYYFANGSENELDRLYNPQLVFRYLSALKRGKLVTELEESPTTYTTNILKSIADTGEFSVEDIVRLVAAGFRETKIFKVFGFVDLMEMSGKDSTVTLSLLMYMGVLTHDVRPGIVRIPNDLMKATILERIKQYIDAGEHFKTKVAPANADLRCGSIDLFIELAEKFMEHRSVRALFMADKAVFQAVVEMLLGPPQARIGEVCLVMDGSKKGSGRFGFVDMFLASDDGPGVLLEVKDIRLAGLISGKKGKWVPNPRNVEIEHLSEELSNIDKRSLDKLRYMYWSEEQQRVQSTTVGQFRKDALQQLERYVQVMKMGCVAKDSDSGVLDKRVKISPGDSDLYSFVVMAIGGRKVLWQSGETLSTEFSYKCTLA